MLWTIILSLSRESYTSKVYSYLLITYAQRSICMLPSCENGTALTITCCRLNVSKLSMDWYILYIDIESLLILGT